MTDLPAPLFISAAAAADFRRISLRLTLPPVAGSTYPGNRIDSAGRRIAQRRLADLGITLEEAEYAVMTPASRMGDFEQLFEAAAELGAKSVVTIMRGFADLCAATEMFAQFCSGASQHSLGVLLEFIAISSVSNIEQAADIVSASRYGRAQVTVDILHLLRSGGTVEDVKRQPSQLVGMGQINDGPLRGPHEIEAQLKEMSAERLRPGQGRFPLMAFVDALPSAVPIGIEVQRADASLDLDAAIHEATLLRHAAQGCLLPQG